MRGESTETQRGCGGGGGPRGPEVEWRRPEERTRRRRGGWWWLRSAPESREKRGLITMSSWESWPPEEEDEEESEKREEASESDASESELSRRSGADARSDDARPLLLLLLLLLRWRRNLRDLAADDVDEPVVVLLPGVLANADGEGEGLGLCEADDDDALLSPSSSRHRLEQLGALGEKTYWSAVARPAAARSGFIVCSAGGGGIACDLAGGGTAVQGSGSGAAALRSGSSLPSAKSSSAGSMLAAHPPKLLNSKSMKSFEMAGVATGEVDATAVSSCSSAAMASRPLNETRGASQPHGVDDDDAAVGASRLLATAEVMARRRSGSGASNAASLEEAKTSPGQQIALETDGGARYYESRGGAGERERRGV